MSGKQPFCIFVVLAIASATVGYWMGYSGIGGPEPKKTELSSASKSKGAAPLAGTSEAEEDFNLPPYDPANPAGFFEALGARAHLLATKRLDDYPDAATKDPDFYGLISYWLSFYPKEALEWLSQQPASWLLPFLEDQAFAITRRSPETGVALLKMLDAQGRYPSLEAALATSLPMAPGKVEAILQENPRLFTEPHRTELLKNWAKEDGPSVVQYLTTAGIEGALQQELLAECAKSAPKDALAAATQVQDDGKTLARVLRAVAEETPFIALGYLQDHPLSGAADKAGLVAFEALQDGGWRTEDILLALPQSLQKYGELFQIRGETDPVVAARKLDELATKEDTSLISKGGEMATEVAKLYASSNPGAALEWTVSLPSSWRAPALEAAASRVAKNDPVALSEWLAKAPPSPELDAVIQQLILQIPDDPEAAYAWAARISSPPLRVQLLSTALDEWRVLDPETAPASPTE